MSNWVSSLVSCALVAIILGCHAAHGPPAAPPPGPTLASATAKVPVPRSTDREWIDSVSREFGFAAKSGAAESATANESPSTRPSHRTVQSSSTESALAPETPELAVAEPPISYPDDTRPRTLLGALGLLSLITIIALTRRS